MFLIPMPELMKEPFVRCFRFFRSEENQHLATWIQTMAVVGGVIVALNQLDTIVRQDQIKSNVRYLEMEKKFSSEISRKMGLLYEHYVNRKRLNDDEFSEMYALDDILNTRRDVEVYITDLSSCGTLEVCPKSMVNSTVCSHSMYLHTLMSEPLNLPSAWKIKLHGPIFYERMINEHCNIFQRAYYWWRG